MAQADSVYFTAVQECLHQMGQAVTFTADERDVIDDFELQQFSADACAKHITERRN